MKFNVPIYTAVAVIVAAMLFSCATVETPQMGPMETLRSSVILADGTPLPADGEYILLYYAADWCPYCLGYTEQLKSSYTALKRLYGRSFDLVFVGQANDTENEQLLAFMEMGAYPFGYLPYEKREASGVMALIGRIASTYPVSCSSTGKGRCSPHPMGHQSTTMCAIARSMPCRR